MMSEAKKPKVRDLKEVHGINVQLGRWGNTKAERQEFFRQVKASGLVDLERPEIYERRDGKRRDTSVMVRIAQAYLNGETLASVAREYGVSSTRILQRADKTHRAVLFAVYDIAVRDGLGTFMDGTTAEDA